MKRILFLLTAVISFLSMNAEITFHSRILSEEDKTAEIVCILGYYDNIKYQSPLIEIPETVEIDGTDYTVVCIGKEAVAHYNEVEKIILPETVTLIDDAAIIGCKKLKEINLPKDLKRIGDLAFKGCASLNNIEFPDGLVEIGLSAFEDCKSLQKVLLPNSLRTLGAYSFSNCSAIETAVLGSGMEDIGAYSFVGCDNLMTLYSLATVPPHCHYYCFNLWWQYTHDFDSVTEPRVVYVPEASINLYFMPIEERLKQYYDYTMFNRDWLPFLNFQPVANIVAIFVDDSFAVKEGESISIPYKLYNPGDVEIVKTDWTASNPVAADVEEGMVTGLKAGECSIITLTITDASGQTYMAECSVEVAQSAKVNAVEGISASQPKVYDTKGIYRGNSNRHLSSGVYVIREGNESHKVVIP